MIQLFSVYTTIMVLGRGYADVLAFANRSIPNVAMAHFRYGGIFRGNGGFDRIALRCFV